MGASPKPPGGWTGELVRDRLLEAMRTLHRLPRERNYQRVRTSWANDTFARDPAAVKRAQWQAELYALELPQAEQEERRQERLRKWARVPPSAAEIARMDEALFWPADHLDEDGRRFLNLWAHGLGVHNSTRLVCGIFGISRKTAWLRAGKLCQVIAAKIGAG